MNSPKKYLPCNLYVLKQGLKTCIVDVHVTIIIIDPINLFIHNALLSSAIHGEEDIKEEKERGHTCLNNFIKIIVQEAA